MSMPSTEVERLLHATKERSRKLRHRRRLLGTAAAAVVVAAVMIPTALLAGGRSRQGVTVAPNPPTSTSPSVPATTARTEPRACSPGALSAVATFNATGTELGAIKISRSAGPACSLSGRPEVTVLGGDGTALPLTETAYRRAGLPATHGSVVLSSSSGPPQAIVSLDLIWCGPSPGTVHFEVRFPGWSSPLAIPTSAVSPLGFLPYSCASQPGPRLLAVDYVRGLSGPPANTLSESCTASQLQAQLVGIQGAAGNFAAAFWVADTSPAPCTLQSPARIDLLNANGSVTLSATQAFAPIQLTARTPIPSGNPPGSERLASVVLFWPTDANAAASSGSPSGYCPTPDFVASAARLTFGNRSAVLVTNLRSNGFRVSICGQRISLQGVQAVGGN